MKFHLTAFLPVLIILLFSLADAGPEAKKESKKHGMIVTQLLDVAPERPIGLMAQARLEGSLTGTITFYQESSTAPVLMTGVVKGFGAFSNQLHGFHIHEIGDTSDDCAASGGHFNPEGVSHGAPDDHESHVGDHGNIRDVDGTAEVCIIDHDITLYSGVNNVVGRTMLIHRDEDDLGTGGDEGSAASGNSGPRLACGVIEIVDTVTPPPKCH